MKRILSTVIMFAAAFCAYAQETAVTYALPQTTLHFEVEAVQETFYAGPYAKYAQKYLGQEARQENGSTCHISSVKLVPSWRPTRRHASPPCSPPRAAEPRLSSR